MNTIDSFLTARYELEALGLLDTYVYNNKTLRTIAKERNKTPQRICDIIRRGYEFLRTHMNEKDLYWN